MFLGPLVLFGSGPVRFGEADLFLSYDLRDTCIFTFARPVLPQASWSNPVRGAVCDEPTLSPMKQVTVHVFFHEIVRHEDVTQPGEEGFLVTDLYRQERTRRLEVGDS